MSVADYCGIGLCAASAIVATWLIVRAVRNFRRSNYWRGIADREFKLSMKYLREGNMAKAEIHNTARIEAWKKAFDNLWA